MLDHKFLAGSVIAAPGVNRTWKQDDVIALPGATTADLCKLAIRLGIKDMAVGIAGRRQAAYHDVIGPLHETVEAVRLGRRFELGAFARDEDFPHPTIPREICDSLRVPFEVTAVTLKVGAVAMLVGLWGDDQGRLVQMLSTTLELTPDGERMLGHATLAAYTDQRDGKRALKSPNLVTAEQLQALHRVATASLLLINDDRMPARRIEANVKLNRARARAGRLPSAGFWKIDVQASPETYVTKIGSRSETPRPMGRGSHRSPVPHDRRGHQRRLRSGKTVWVRSCRIGELIKHLTRTRRDFYQVDHQTAGEPR